MAFNIKNEETIAVAREIAARTGESIAQVFDAAIREHARTMPDEVDRRRTAVRRLVDDVAVRLEQARPGPGSRDIGAFLYDEETGLPT